jgi:hypothetical protein
LLEEQYNAPMCVIAFNIVEGWARDVSGEIAVELAKLCLDRDEKIPASLKDFLTTAAHAPVNTGRD